MTSPRKTYLVAPTGISELTTASGTTYQTDKHGIIPEDASELPPGDAIALLNMGCLPFTPLHIGHATGLDLTVTEDQEIPIFVPQGILYRPYKIVLVNASTTPQGSAFGISSEEGGQGTVLIPDGASTSGLTDPLTALEFTPVNPLQCISAESDACLYFTVTSPESEPCTVDVYVYGDIYWPYSG